MWLKSFYMRYNPSWMLINNIYAEFVFFKCGNTNAYQSPISQYVKTGGIEMGTLGLNYDNVNEILFTFQFVMFLTLLESTFQYAVKSASSELIGLSVEFSIRFEIVTLPNNI